MRDRTGSFPQSPAARGVRREHLDGSPQLLVRVDAEAELSFANNFAGCAEHLGRAIPEADAWQPQTFDIDPPKLDELVAWFLRTQYSPEQADAFGDRRGYQMDPANGRMALDEALTDVAEGRTW